MLESSVTWFSTYTEAHLQGLIRKKFGMEIAGIEHGISIHEMKGGGKLWVYSEYPDLEKQPDLRRYEEEYTNVSFGIVGQTKCFVLPSLYECPPMDRYKYIFGDTSYYGEDD